MKFSAQEEYGLRCLVRIAQVGLSGSITIPEIGRLEGLSATHVAKLMMILRKGGFIRSTRGQAGGYSLARPAREISLGEVLAELGGRLYDEEFCVRHRGQLDACSRGLDCTVRSLWNRLQDAVDLALKDMSLEDLLAPEPGPTRKFETLLRTVES